MTDPVVEAFLRHLGEGEREAFEERAAIREYEAATPRPLAEALALLDVLHAKAIEIGEGDEIEPSSCPSPIPMPSVWAVELDGERLYVLVTDEAQARQHIRDLHGALDPKPLDLVSVVQEMGGLACLRPLG